MGHVASSRLPADGPGTSSPSDTASRRPARSSISSGWWSLSMPASHTAILLLAYGSPNRLEDVEPYFTDIRGGRTPSQEAVEELRSRYRRGGGPIPLLSASNGSVAALGATTETLPPAEAAYTHAFRMQYTN